MPEARFVNVSDKTKAAKSKDGELPIPVKLVQEPT